MKIHTTFSRLVEESTPHSLIFEFRDKDLIRYNKLGFVKMKTSDIRDSKIETKWYALHPSGGLQGGEVYIELGLYDQNVCNLILTIFVIFYY
jgi:hypothetical protein